MSKAAKSHFCHICGRPLGSQFYRYAQGMVVCVTCQASRPKCVGCGVPLPIAHHSAPDGGLCAACLRTASRCACCGDPITQTWHTFEELLPPDRERRFCERCMTHRPRCDICRAPVPPGAVTLPDGQFRCSMCATDLVLGDAAVRAVYTEALSRARQSAGIQPVNVPELAVVGRRKMGDVRRHFAAHMPEGAGGQHILGFFVREHGVSTIFVELGLPRPLLLGTLAHELAHAWQAEAAPDVADPLVREGFAEWVAHRVLVSARQRRVAALATRRDDLYGRGLRHFLGIERDTGPASVLEAARGLHGAPASPHRKGSRRSTS